MFPFHIYAILFFTLMIVSSLFLIVTKDKGHLPTIKLSGTACFLNRVAWVLQWHGVL
jgi:hypothetical protein